MSDLTPPRIRKLLQKDIRPHNQPHTSNPSSSDINSLRSQHLHTLSLLRFPVRAAFLFLIGYTLSLVIIHLLQQHEITEHPLSIFPLSEIPTTPSPSSILNHHHTSTNPKRPERAYASLGIWIPPFCGLAALLVGTAYPMMDYFLLDGRHKVKRDWSSVLRCVGGFIGICYAASKLPWTSNIQVTCTLALISVCLWFLFDRTWHGFAVSITFSSIGTGFVYLFVANGMYSFTKADFIGVRSWIPCILYSSCICFGSIGRHLEAIPNQWYHRRQKHQHWLQPQSQNQRFLWSLSTKDNSEDSGIRSSDSKAASY